MWRDPAFWRGVLRGITEVAVLLPAALFAYVVFAIVCNLVDGTAKAQTAAEQRMLARAAPYLPTVKAQLASIWPDAPMPSFIPAQIEQESLWNPKANLKTAREEGSGLGQFTRTAKFDAYEEVRKMHPALADWRYEDRFDPTRQIIAVVVKDRAHYRQCVKLMSGRSDAMACVAASYNGGYGGFLSDRRLCSNTKGCDPRQWFGHVEHTSMKARHTVAGYGKGFFYINREYVVNVLRVRRPKYLTLMGDTL